jgi:hypothetical protein
MECDEELAKAVFAPRSCRPTEESLQLGADGAIRKSWILPYSPVRRRRLCQSAPRHMEQASNLDDRYEVFVTPHMGDNGRVLWPGGGQMSDLIGAHCVRSSYRARHTYELTQMSGEFPISRARGSELLQVSRIILLRDVSS